jgi:hypothetical protein
MTHLRWAWRDLAKLRRQIEARIAAQSALPKPDGGDTSAEPQKGRPEAVPAQAEGEERQDVRGPRPAS